MEGCLWKQIYRPNTGHLHDDEVNDDEVNDDEVNENEPFCTFGHLRDDEVNDDEVNDDEVNDDDENEPFLYCGSMYFLRP